LVSRRRVPDLRGQAITDHWAGSPSGSMPACFGDHFTMGPKGAAEAVKLASPERVVLMHYGTFVPMMTGTPEQFKAELRALGLEKKFLPMVVGQTKRF
jgi:L-ascorbate metabolism protein UlaG (beta-lactamase superfamily)